MDITVVWAGPHCTQLLAEWGAEVIRAEPLGRMQLVTRGMTARPTKEMVQASRAGSWAYHYPDWDPGERPWNRDPMFNSHGRNKRSMTTEIMTPEGRSTMRDLISVSDVFVENNVPQTIERARLTYEELRKVNPALIALRMPAYGLSGPYKEYRSFGTHMEGTVGHHYIRGYRDADPTATGDIFAADAAAGVMGAFAVVMALRHRRRTGRGQQVEMGQAENFLPYLGEFVMDYTMNGRVTEPMGNSHRAYAPHNVYPCAGDDRWIAIAVTDEGEWAGLRRAMGDPTWASEDRFQSGIGRKQDEAELDRKLCEWTKDKDAIELFRLLGSYGVPAGPVQNEVDAYNCPQLKDRGFFEEQAHPEAGTHAYPGLNFRMSKTSNRLRTPAPLLGEHNEYVYRELLGYSNADYDRLVEEAHIGMDYPPDVV